MNDWINAEKPSASCTYLNYVITCTNVATLDTDLPVLELELGTTDRAIRLKLKGSDYFKTTSGSIA